MNTNEIKIPPRQAAINSLAVVGFITLVSLGVSLAVYSTRYIPDVVSNLGTAAVSLSQIFTTGPKSSLSVVHTASTTIPFGNATSTANIRSTPTPATTNPKKIVPVVPKVAGEKTIGTYQMDGTAGTLSLSGLPDFIVTIKAVGYLATTSAESFVATSTVPTGSRPAITFNIKNIGTNATGIWRFSASIPTQTAYIYQSQPQQSLNPGDRIDYTLGFDQATPGADKMISITANFDRAISESNISNNSASTKITILGS